MQTREQDRLGWFWPAGALALSMALMFFSASSFGAGLEGRPTDFQTEIAKSEAESAQILNTLGRGKAANSATSAETEKTVKVRLRRAPKARKAQTDRV